MPYNEPIQQGNGFILPKKSGGAHKSASGKVVHFKTKAGAKKVARYVNALEHGWKPSGKPRPQRYATV